MGNFKSNTYILFMIILAISLSGCLKNDFPYPRIQQNITELAAVGQSKAAQIDSLSREAVIYLEETTDIENVEFSKFSVSPGGESDKDLLKGTYDLSHPLYLSIKRYQSYDWEISAIQDIERYFTVSGQIGETVIDVAAKRVIVSMPEGTDLGKLTLEKVKLGPAGITTYYPELAPGVLDLSFPLLVEVKCHGRTEVWTIYAQLTELRVSTDRVDPWSQVIWAYGSCPSDQKGGFQYRKADEISWRDVPRDLITQTEGAFSCYIPHLQPLTDYVVRATTESEFGNEVRVTTYGTADLPDGSFDQWWLKNNKIWCPWDENGLQFWDTGNTGASTLGQSNVVPTDHTVTGSGKAAELNTKFVGIGSIGKLAAGSIYTGFFKKVDGTNGILDFGQPWKLRPTRLKGYYQYKTAAISHSNSEYKDLIGRPDTCHIYIALADWTAPFEVRTNPKNRQLFDKNMPSVIGYGELIYSGTMDDYRAFDIKIDYRDTSRIPSYILITCAASKYGDFFTGAQGAVLYVDQFSLDYDY